MSFAFTFPQRRDTGGIGEEFEVEDAAAELFAEAQARAREQAAYEQLKASGMYMCYQVYLVHNITFECRL